MLRIYTLSNCDTCRAATKWLRAHALDFDERPIRQTPPTVVELRAALAANGGELRKLFNTSGRDYREQKLGEKLDTLSVAAALALLAGNGNLVKRPFLIGDGSGNSDGSDKGGVALMGFDAERWRAMLKPRAEG